MCVCVCVCAHTKKIIDLKGKTADKDYREKKKQLYTPRLYSINIPPHIYTDILHIIYNVHTLFLKNLILTHLFLKSRKLKMTIDSWKFQKSSTILSITSTINSIKHVICKAFSNFKDY